MKKTKNNIKRQREINSANFILSQYKIDTEYLKLDALL